MIKKLLAALGIGLVTNGSANGAEFYEPYAQSHLNFLYNLLFCDDLALFRKNQDAKRDGLWTPLLAEPPDKAALREIAESWTNEGRVRALAYNRLRAVGEKVPPKRLLGVIVEVPMEGGLDVLAAFSEGGVRYINQSGKLLIFEGEGHPVEDLAKELIDVAQPLVNSIGPWGKPRLPPPEADNVRLTFLVSDGLYFGQGKFEALQSEPMAAPILNKATQLLRRAIELGS